MKVAATFAGLAACLAVAGGAQAAVFTVDALAHSSNSGGGTGLATVSLNAGDAFTLSADANDLWNAGALPRWSNANGLTGDLFATGSDESGQAAGTLIGSDFGLLTIDGFSAPYGALVGQIGTGPGSYRLLGTGFSGAAWATGSLVLYYWDTFTADNTNSVDVNIGLGVVPEPAAWAMMIAGFGLAGATLRRRRAVSA
jgi:hypothetical protein